jgi:PncC family amidohydrolase
LKAEEGVGQLLRERGKTIALAESCTGGLIASRLTDIPGSSDYFLLSLVTYSDRSKVELLGVKRSTLDRHGAVSEAVAGEMAAGARRAAGADVGLSVTGIAGPGGGSAEKPVGLVYFCIDDGAAQVVDKVIFPGDRLAVKRAASDHALGMVLSRL